MKNVITLERADEFIETLQIMAEDNYFDIESNNNYLEMLDMITSADDIGANTVYYPRFIYLFKLVKKEIEEF